MEQITRPDIEDYCARISEPPSEVRRALQDYTNANVEWPQMIVGDLVGSFLQFMVKSRGAQRILEVGCFTGYSALAMAEALPEDGRLITLDVNEETNAIAREYWAKSPHGSKIEARLGEARETLKDLEGPFDLVFIDADKIGYREYFDLALPMLAEHGAIILDNCLMGGGALDPEHPEESTRAIAAFNAYVSGRADLCKMLLPLRDGLLLVTRV